MQEIYQYEKQKRAHIRGQKLQHWPILLILQKVHCKVHLNINK